jgi:hypothetical protein
MNKYRIADTSFNNIPDDRGKNYRGLNVWTLSELRSIQGQTKSGRVTEGTIQYPLFALDPFERSAIMQSSTYIQAVVTSRMNRISSLEWTVNTEKEIEDETYDQLKDWKQIYFEYGSNNELNDIVLRYRLYLAIKEHLHDIKQDLSNFDAALLRWKKRIDRQNTRKNNEIIEWLSQPNMEDDFDDWVKKYVQSLMIHGAVGIYKEFSQENKLENFYVLPGGSVYPLRGVNVGSYVAYVQMMTGHFPKMYFQNEISFVNYVPSATRSYGYVPLDALINKISEQLLFDQFAAMRADGTKEPEKLVLFGDNKSLFGDLTGDISLPMDTAKQKRIEEKLNTIRQGAIVTLSGVGTPVIADISKADTFSAQSARQDQLLRDVALLFNMTNMEVNLAGGQFTNGRETSETQSEIEEGKGTRPIIKKIEKVITKDKIPYRFGYGHIFQFQKTKSDEEQVELDTRRNQSGTWTPNEIRLARGDDPIPGPENDKLPTGQAAQPDGTQANPFNMRGV